MTAAAPKRRTPDGRAANSKGVAHADVLAVLDREQEVDIQDAVDALIWTRNNQRNAITRLTQQRDEARQARAELAERLLERVEDAKGYLVDIHRLRALLREAIYLAEMGDVDESAEAYGWGEWMKSAKSACLSPIANGQPVEGPPQ